MGSDHRIVSAHVHPSLRANKIKTSRPTRYDWSTLKNEKEVSEKFKLELTNRFSILQSENVEEANNASYINFETACHEAAEICIPKKPVAKRKKPWENDRITEKRNKLKYASSQQLSIPNAANLSLVKEAKKELRKTYEKEQSAYLQTKIDEIKSAADNKQSALAWNTVNEISGRKRSYKAKLKASDQEEME